MEPETFRMLFQILFAAFLGLVMGLERQHSGKTAGLRTYALIAMGAALFTILSVEGFSKTTGLPDPTRVASQVVIGVGFLAGGLIFVKGGSVVGLTTAAGLWVSAAIGMAVGLQMYSIATFTAILALIILWPLKKLESRMGIADEDSGNDKNRGV